MKVHLYVDMWEIYPIGWISPRSNLTPGYRQWGSPGVHSHQVKCVTSVALTNMRKHTSCKKQSWDEVSGAVSHQSPPVLATQDSGPSPGSSLVHRSSSCPGRTPNFLPICLLTVIHPSPTEMSAVKENQTAPQVSGDKTTPGEHRHSSERQPPTQDPSGKEKDQVLGLGHLNDSYNFSVSICPALTSPPPPNRAGPG